MCSFFVYDVFFPNQATCLFAIAYCSRIHVASIGDTIDIHNIRKDELEFLQPSVSMKLRNTAKQTVKVF